MAVPPPPGVYVPVPTFFVSKKAANYASEAPPLDLETQTKHAIHLAKCGIRGLVVLGSTGEAIAITNRERSELLKHVRRELEAAGYKDYPIIVGTATQGIEDTIQQLKDAKDGGAQWGLVLAPVGALRSLRFPQDKSLGRHPPRNIMLSLRNSWRARSTLT